MMCGGDSLSLQFEWYDHTRDGEWGWLGSVILSSWVLLDALLCTGLTLPTHFFVVMWWEILLESQQHPEVVYEFGGVAESSVALLPVHMLEQHPIWLSSINPSLQYLGRYLTRDGIGLSVDSTELSKEEETVFKVCMDQVWARRISHCWIFVYTGIDTSYTWFLQYFTLFHPHI